MNDKIHKIKHEKPFKIFDLIIYIVIEVLILSFFIFFLPKKNKSYGITATYNGNKIFYYDNIKDTLTFYDLKIFTYDLTESNDKFLLRLDFVEGFNLIEIDKKTDSIQITDSNCHGKDCMHTVKNAPIICIPHGLVIKSETLSKPPQPSIG